MKKKIPFDFILDLLYSIPIEVKPMFGCHAIYSNGKILLILRKKDDHADANGIWIATDKEHHKSLKKDLPSIQSVYILSNGKGETNWQMIHDEAIDFEESVSKICNLILKNDIRIGKIPKAKTKKSNADKFR
ncbi:MAG TPA: hypothetical protein VFL70_00795 [Bacteroidia bacterium]|nr:hypothetical protein [Bacteroidia bacterium]